MGGKWQQGLLNSQVTEIGHDCLPRKRITAPLHHPLCPLLPLSLFLPLSTSLTFLASPTLSALNLCFSCLYHPGGSPNLFLPVSFRFYLPYLPKPSLNRIYIIYVSLSLSPPPSFAGTEDWAQDPAFARQVLMTDLKSQPHVSHFKGRVSQQPRLASNLPLSKRWTSCFHLPSGRLIGMCHHDWLSTGLKREDLVIFQVRLKTPERQLNCCCHFIKLGCTF